MKVNIGKGLEVEVDTKKFNNEVGQHVWYIGLRNLLMDSHASINPNTVPKNVNGHVLDDVQWASEIKRQSLAAAQKKLNSMYAGEVRAVSERSRLDPIEAEARRMALSAIQDSVRKSGKKLNTVTTDDLAARVTANYPKFMEVAAKVVALRQSSKIEVE